MRGKPPGYRCSCDPRPAVPTPEIFPIPFSLKHLLIRVAAGLVAAVGAIGRFLGLGLRYGLGRPLGILGRFVFRFVLLPLYHPYTRMKQRLVKNPALKELEGVGHFLQRYALYAVLVLLGVFVTGNNLFARTIRPDEIGQGAIWTAFVSSENPDLIVESTPAKKMASAATVLAVGGASSATTLASAPTTADTTQVAVGQDRIGDTGQGATPVSRNDTVQYTVVAGDTISTIADRFEISTRTILWANNLSETAYIKPGQNLKIPAASGVLYTVKNGDTLASIVKKYKGNIDEIITANQLSSADTIQPGTEILIPNGEVPAPPAPAPVSRTLIGGLFTSPATKVPPSARASGARFIWPTPSHRINQYYRGHYHTGIDIEGGYSSPIYAAAAGTVVFAAYDRSGYGLHVIIDHGNGYRTLYGHASKIFVHSGQHVSQGQTIAMVGSTGRSTGTHLHYEIRPCATYSCSPFLNPLAFY